MRIGIVVTPEELLFPDNFSAIFICQRGKAIGKTSAVTGPAQSTQGSPVKEPRRMEDVTNSFKRHWCGKRQTCVDIRRFEASGNLYDDVNDDETVAGKADSQSWESNPWVLSNPNSALFLVYSKRNNIIKNSLY